MRFLFTLSIAAYFAAIFVIKIQSSEGCGDGDTNYPLDSPLSREIRTDTTSGDLTLSGTVGG